MRLQCAFIAALAVSAAAIEPVLTQAPRVVHGINGSWEAYPVRGDGFGSGIPAKTPVPAAAPIPEAPLKQPYLDEWRAVQKQNQELARKGLPPLSTGMAACRKACRDDGSDFPWRSSKHRVRSRSFRKLYSGTRVHLARRRLRLTTLSLVSTATRPPMDGQHAGR